jgi:hypothetical protein
MLLSSRAQAALNKDDSELLNKLIDSIVPNLAFPGSSDFLPGADINPELLDSISRPSLYEKDENEFAKLGDLGRSVRLFLPRMLTRFHSGVHQALTSSLKSLSYLGPLRSVPPRHMAFTESSALGHPAEGAQAWQELATNKPVRDKVNEWLSSDKRLKTPYRLRLFEYVGETELDELAVRLLEAGAVEGGQAAYDAHILNDENAQAAYKSRDHAIHGDPPDDDQGDRSVFGQEELQEVFSTHCDFEDSLNRLKEEGFLRTDWRRPSDVVLVDMRTGTEVSHRDVGIGVSQVLPVLVQAYASKHALIAMEQPEIHLHPALQAEIGDVFIESALGEQQNRFVLETHSEHLILRILRRIREASKQENPTITASDVAVLYVDPSPDGAEVFEMEVSEDGQILSQWPGGFFPERMKEMFGEI